MRYQVRDEKYHFKYAFDTKTGAYVRTGILDENGKDTGVDPFMASFPHLIDVGVMGHCIHGKTGLCVKAGIGCYQSGLTKEEPNMSVEDFTWLAEQSEGKVNQFALGGRGDPDQHEHFEELLKISREHHIVPNFTTSGYGMTEELASICKKYCGAVAVSWYRSEYTIRAIKMLLSAGVKTNIHYVLGRNSIDEAIERLSGNDFPKGINAVVFCCISRPGWAPVRMCFLREMSGWRGFSMRWTVRIRLRSGWTVAMCPEQSASAGG